MPMHASRRVSRRFQLGEGPSRGLLRDCEIFGNLRITFVSSSNAQAAPALVPQPPPNFSFGRLRIQPIATPGRGNHNFEGRSYLLSWREEGRPRYSWAQARDFCSSAGMRLLSLDTAAKLDHFLGLAATQVRSDQART